MATQANAAYPLATLYVGKVKLTIYLKYKSNLFFLLNKPI